MLVNQADLNINDEFEETSQFQRNDWKLNRITIAMNLDFIPFALYTCKPLKLIRWGALAVV